MRTGADLVQLWIVDVESGIGLPIVHRYAVGWHAHFACTDRRAQVFQPGRTLRLKEGEPPGRRYQLPEETRARTNPVVEKRDDYRLLSASWCSLIFDDGHW